MEPGQQHSQLTRHLLTSLHKIQGEISLRGRITAVGGIKEKLIGALRAGVKTVLLPAQNRKDVRDLPQEVRDGLEIVHVRYVLSCPEGKPRVCVLEKCVVADFGGGFVLKPHLGGHPPCLA
jgi:hypothetical protein